MFFDIDSRGRNVRNSSSPAIGLGPERGVYRAVPAIMSSDRNFWMMRNQHLVPVFSPTRQSNPIRLATFKVYGSYLGLHMALFGQGAAPTSFALPLAFVRGPKAMRISPHYLHAMDPEAATKLSPWFEMRATDPMPTIQHAEHPLVLFLVDELNMQACPFLTASKNKHSCLQGIRCQ
jgi:hypothetical protein